VELFSFLGGCSPFCFFSEITNNPDDDDDTADEGTGEAEAILWLGACCAVLSSTASLTNTVVLNTVVVA
jgi:hypothetical protein